MAVAVNRRSAAYGSSCAGEMLITASATAKPWMRIIFNSFHGGAAESRLYLSELEEYPQARSMLATAPAVFSV